MKVVGYIRVSTEEQSAQGVSLAAQRHKVEAYADLHDLELVAVIVDEGQSAKTIKRPGLQAALAMIDSGEVDGLVVCKLDRLSRSVADWNHLIDSYFGDKAGKQLLSIQDSVDTRSAAGRLVLNVLMSVAQWEREAIGERTRDALSHKRRSGQRVGKVPFGFSLGLDGKSLLAIEAEQQALKVIHELRAKGGSMREIASELDRRGIKTKGGAATWTHTTIARILSRAA